MSLHVKIIGNKTNPIVIGAECIKGPVEVGMSVGVDVENNNIGIISTIEVNTKYVRIIHSGEKAVIKIDSNYEFTKLDSNLIYVT